MEGFPKVGDVLVWTEPPDGYHVNFTNPQKDTVLLHASLGVSISCVISLLLTGINLYVAFLVTKKPFPQHFLALAGCVLVAASQSIIFVCQMRGVLGVHVWEMPLDHARWESTLLLAANLLAIPATALAKSGLYVFYHEVIGVTPRAYFILIPAAFSIVAFVVMWIIQLFACTPIQAAWNLTYYTETSCHSRYYCGTAQASVGILADLCITSLALFRTFQLQMPIRTDIRLLMRRTLASRETGGNRAAPVAQQGPTRSSDASKVSSMHILVPSRLFPSNLRFNVIGHTTEKPDGIRS
ncbi:hypothetical protein AU210_016045 [Fusarium oxysporum f. sp. radicis-cucumerinum]|uniref:Rhodopsin domain-containing protein n=1 Tax=Fusarium oxysporum f. sp. radicis-cucumerinum TaxID=327505 RepID=A0A2H3FSL9_FUSOX|nr:hypothetical protein AU210_016045 [Fusarium oxysporum f. sp. radicis-cucumerinum]